MTDQTLQSEKLNVDTLPLTGIRLIEASAGTGKTYTITSLYLRLILGDECTALSPEQILVVTFTRAATEELRDRIRKRIKVALAGFNQGTCDDPFIDHLKNKLDADQLSKGKQRLKDALQLMDLAAIYTIHGFAQRLLRQYAVEADVSSEFELIINDGDILLQAVQDVWRRSVYPLSGNTLSLILSAWSSPEALLKNVRNLLNQDAEFHLGDHSEREDFEKASLQYHRAIEALKQEWAVSGQGFVESIQNNKDLNGTYNRGFLGRIKTIDACFAGQQVKSSDLEKAFSSFTKQGLLKSVKKNGEPVEHKISDDFQAACDYLGPYEKAKSLELKKWRISFIKQIKQRLQILKDQKQVIATDDLLLKLKQGLYNHDDALLADPIRQIFPVAMVDEFQDTDAAQYQVFRKLYVEALQQSSHKGSQDRELALFMIGDPKQAIYKFRGADIFTYIQAKNEATARYSLDTNYRSTAPMVNGVNTLFSQHDSPFIYDQDIPFIKVAAKDDAERLFLAGKEEKAITWQYLNIDQKEFTKKEEVTESFAQSCAEQISVLLNHNDANLVDGNGSRPVQAKDMAVLVRSGSQAKVVRDALNQRGIGCVYVGQDNVFESSEAQALLMLLQAVHALSERKFRNAIAHPVWQLSLTELSYCLLNENKWEDQLEQLYQAHEVWMKQGVMPMIMNWLHQRKLPQAWLALENGERLLTNMMHLAELLQETSSEVQGMQGLLTWFDQQVTGSILGDGEQKQLRLESDANLIQIVTIHKSKGLEYPIVFLPYCWSATESKDEVFYEQTRQQLLCDLTDDYKAQRIQEGLAEELRLLYVGLTRAATKCYLSMPSISSNSKASRLNKSIMDSPLKYVLFAHADKGSLGNVWEHLSGFDESSFALEPLAETVTPLIENKQRVNLEAKPYTGHIKRDWHLSSFSSLVRHHHAPHSARFNLDDETDVNIEKPLPTQLSVENGFTFPRGAHAGNFLHTLLEEVDFTCLPDDIDHLILDLLVRFGIEEKWLPVVKQWLDVILESPLQHAGLSLNKLTDELKQVEMEFYFPISRLSSREFNGLLNQYSVLNSPVTDVEFQTIKGMMKGFIDLTFCWHGQYFILDYKSNHLGDDVSCYDDDQLHQAMGDHRYDVQLVLYTLALHRLLKLRIANYDYDQHIGGGYYLFLRGLNMNDHRGQFFHKPDAMLIDALDQLISAEPSAVDKDNQMEFSV